LKIAYVTLYDACHEHAWSGSGQYILRALQESGFETEIIDSLREGNGLLFKLKKKIYTKILSKTYYNDCEPTLLRRYARQVEKRLASIQYNIVFCLGSRPIANLRTDKPIVFWSDATFAGMIDFYPEFTNLCKENIINGNKADQLALSKCRIAIFTSEWAAESAIKNYDVDPEKVKVVPFGANVSCNRDLREVSRISENKNFDICKLLFLGIGWQRKGGDKALAVAHLLNKRGFRTELHIVGCTPPVQLPDFVKLHGFISKKTEEGRRHLDRLFSEAHFLILPTRADCTPVVFAEASSFGLPSLATRVGGIPTAIKDGKNGKTFLLNEDPEKYCDYIEQLMSSKQKYGELALSSFREYSERLNWSSAGKKVYELIQDFCG